jgi:hypothetical protein
MIPNHVILLLMTPNNQGIWLLMIPNHVILLLTIPNSIADIFSCPVRKGERTNSQQAAVVPFPILAQSTHYLTTVPLTPHLPHSVSTLTGSKYCIFKFSSHSPDVLLYFKYCSLLVLQTAPVSGVCQSVTTTKKWQSLSTGHYNKPYRACKVLAWTGLSKPTVTFLSQSLAVCSFNLICHTAVWNESVMENYIKRARVLLTEDLKCKLMPFSTYFCSEIHTLHDLKRIIHISIILYSQSI